MNEYGGIDMKLGHEKGRAEMNDPHQGGNKAAPRGGANDGMVDHHLVDRIDHGAQSVRVKNAMGEMGHHNVEYYHGGKM